MTQLPPKYAPAMGNVKIFPQLMFKSRGLAKISERKLQPLCLRNCRLKLGFNTLLHCQRGGGGGGGGHGESNNAKTKENSSLRNRDIKNIKIKSLLYPLEYMEAKTRWRAHFRNFASGH